MGVKTYTKECELGVSASRVFKAMVLDDHNFLPKVLPQGFKSIDIVHGDGGVGTIKQINFGESTQSKHMKHKIDVLDKENLVYKYTLIEGDMLGDKLERIVYEVKFVPVSDGKCCLKMMSEYHTVGNFELNEEEVKSGKERAMGMFKAIEKYLLDNPTAYA